MFSNPISTLSTHDLAALLTDEAVENVRLEFKSEMPSKQETLKKLSSFANTFGGYLVIGAAADSTNGRLTALPGVALESGFKQRIVQWCFDGISPPLTVEVSDPIPTPDNNSTVCYVLYIRESDLAPHFLNGRKGVYIRTDEYSQRFEPQLATQEELLALLNRRSLIIARRGSLIERARLRFGNFVNARYGRLDSLPDGIGAYFDLAIISRFPSDRLTTQAEALKKIQEVRLPWRRVEFPRTTEGVVSQHESAIVLRPGSSFSLLEFNVWGLLYYATEIERKDKTWEGIHLYHFLGHLLVFLSHAKRIMETFHMVGPIEIELRLDAVLGVHWIYAESNQPVQGPASLLDNSVTFSLSLSAERLRERTDGVAMDLLEYVLFAMNWASMVENKQQLRDLLRSAYEYNQWSIPELFSE